MPDFAGHTSPLSYFLPMNFCDRSLIATVQRALPLALSCLFAAFAGHTAMAQAAKPQPDTIVFTNGDQLTGTFERAVGDTVFFKSDMAGEITVPLSKIKELRSGATSPFCARTGP